MRILKEYLLRGLVRDQRIGKLEKRMSATFTFNGGTLKAL